MPETILAFDFGLRRIGVAVGQDVTASASPLAVVDNGESGADHATIRRLVDEWRPARLVVGLPTSLGGAPSGITEATRSFIRELGRYGLPVETVDERYTSLEAGQALRDARAAGTRGRIAKGDIDTAAAVLIAERYFSR